jgi:hypothetical protein
MYVLIASLLAWWFCGWKVALCIICPALAFEFAWYWKTGAVGKLRRALQARKVERGANG